MEIETLALSAVVRKLFQVFIKFKTLIKWFILSLSGKDRYLLGFQSRMQAWKTPEKKTIPSMQHQLQAWSYELLYFTIVLY